MNGMTNIDGPGLKLMKLENDENGSGLSGNTYLLFDASAKVTVIDICDELGT